MWNIFSNTNEVTPPASPTMGHCDACDQTLPPNASSFLSHYRDYHPDLDVRLIFLLLIRFYFSILPFPAILSLSLRRRRSQRRTLVQNQLQGCLFVSDYNWGLFVYDNSNYLSSQHEAVPLEQEVEPSPPATVATPTFEQEGYVKLQWYIIEGSLSHGNYHVVLI